MKKTFLFLLLSLQLFHALSRTAEEWKSRNIYQIVTDRFAKTNDDLTPCYNLNKYCGGTFKGIQNNLDYIQDLGFNAIWISPVVANHPDGYHGYWTSDLYQINENFGTPEDLRELVQACHEKGIWVMVDIAANHMAPIQGNDFSQLSPFNDPSHYHPFSRLCADLDPAAIEEHDTCWLHGLPDLDQENPFVRDTLLTWVKEFVKTYNIDGIRLGALKHVSKSFWKDFGKAAGVFMMGETFDYNLPYLASYQGVVDSLLNFPFFGKMRDVFGRGESMRSIEHFYKIGSIVWPDMAALGNFVDNHDLPRFLSSFHNIPAFKSALAFGLCSIGIPTFYYGDEQGYGGSLDPSNREPLWTNKNRDGDIYGFVKKVNQFRKDSEFFKFPQVERYADDNFYAFTRGNYLFAFTNNQHYQHRSITYHPYPEGTVLCNIFHESDCVKVEDNKFPVVLINGEVKIFAPKVQEDPEGQTIFDSFKLNAANTVGLGIQRFNSYLE